MQEDENNQKRRNDDWETEGSCRRTSSRCELKNSKKENNPLRYGKKLRSRASKRENRQRHGHEEASFDNAAADGGAQGQIS